MPAPFKVECKCEVLAGYAVAVEISYFSHRCEVLSVYAHSHKLQEIEGALQMYLSGRNKQLELFIAVDFNLMQEKTPAVWEMILAEGLLRQVSMNVDTYRSGPHSSALDVILHNEHAESARVLRSRVFWPKLLPSGHAVVTVRAAKARLLVNGVAAVKYSAIPLRAFKQHSRVPTLGIPARSGASTIGTLTAFNTRAAQSVSATKPVPPVVEERATSTVCCCAWRPPGCPSLPIAPTTHEATCSAICYPDEYLQPLPPLGRRVTTFRGRVPRHYKRR